MANPYTKNKEGMMGRADASAFPSPMSQSMSMQPKDNIKPMQQQMYGGGMVKKYARGGGTRPVRRY